jgi:hypothetical protein
MTTTMMIMMDVLTIVRKNLVGIVTHVYQEKKLLVVRQHVVMV